MNRILKGLLRQSSYGAIALAATTVMAQTQQQRQQEQPQEQLKGQVTTPLSKNLTTHAAAAAKSVLPFLTTKNHREERFLEFASVEYEGTPYMTPQDFLESVTTEHPRHRQRRKALSRYDLDRILHKAPSRSSASTNLMRNLGHNGIISYPEYLFLLSTMAKANSGIAIAFSMIDRSRNQSVEKEEFATLNTMVSEWQGSEMALQDTTLMRHFFGRSGKKSLNNTDFATFMSNLQYEVLEIEFLEFSKGLPTIAESDFARVLLRYTNLSVGAQEEYVRRIKEKLVHEKGIGFEDFFLFFQFINSLQDLATALRMYNLADHPITQEEFQRAVKACVGYPLAPRVVSTLFLLFDKDGDGSLSAEEFLGILRDRLRRLNPKPRSSDTRLGEFKQCIKRNIRKDVA